MRGIESFQRLYHGFVNIKSDRLRRFARYLVQAVFKPCCFPALAASLSGKLCLSVLFRLLPLRGTCGILIFPFPEPIQLLLLLPTESERFDFVCQTNHFYCGIDQIVG